VSFDSFFTMENIVDCGYFTIKDFPQLDAYMGAMVWNTGDDYLDSRIEALSGNLDQPMPIFYAGQSNFRFRTLHDKPNYDDYDAAATYIPDLIQQLKHTYVDDEGNRYTDFSRVRAFEMPVSDCLNRPAAEAQRDSLLYHASLFRKQQEEFKFPQEWLNIVSERWPSTEHRFVDWLKNFDTLYDKAVDAVIKTSSSGCSVQLGQTKGAALKATGSGPTTKMIVYQRLVLLMSTPYEELKGYSALELVQKGFVDPIRIFLKPEPHKVSKRYNTETGTELPRKRWRIISSCSLVDELVDRILYTWQNKCEIRNWHKTPSMPGVGFSDDNSADQFYYKVLFPQADKDLNLLDFRGWDWGLKQDILDADADVRSNRCGSLDQGMFRKRALTLGFSVFVLDDGSMYEQCIRGIMKSGWFNTSPTNSRGRVLISLLHAAQAAVSRGDDPTPYLEAFFVIAMGDDSVEEKHKGGWNDFINQLIKWGLRPDPDFQGDLTDINHVEFCSHTFDVTPFGQVRANLRNHLKSISKFLYLPRSKRSPEQIAGLRVAFRHAPELALLEQMWCMLFPELYEASLTAAPGPC